jgi:RNA polymerase sigma factor (sigma-70 family)
MRPLKSRTDLELIEAVREDACDDSFNELSLRYERVFYRICHKYTPLLESKGLSPEDIYEEKNYILWLCISNFDPNKGAKFSTWLGNYARYTCFNSVNKRKLIISYDSEEVRQFFEQKHKKNEFEEKGIDFENLYFYLKQIKNKRQKEIVSLRYFNHTKLTWKEIAKRLNISVQTAITSHNDCMSRLKSKIKSKDNL